MATYNDLRQGVKTISDEVEARKQQLKSAMKIIKDQADGLAAIPGVHGKIIADIQGITPSGPAETLAQDELIKILASSDTLQVAVGNVITAIDAQTI